MKPNKDKPLPVLHEPVWPVGTVGYKAEQDFITVVKQMRDIGFGRMIQMIDSLWNSEQPGCAIMTLLEHDLAAKRAIIKRIKELDAQMLSLAKALEYLVDDKPSVEYMLESLIDKPKKEQPAPFVPSGGMGPPGALNPGSWINQIENPAISIACGSETCEFCDDDGRCHSPEHRKMPSRCPSFTAKKIDE